MCFFMKDEDDCKKIKNKKSNSYQKKLKILIKLTEVLEQNLKLSLI